APFAKYEPMVAELGLQDVVKVVNGEYPIENYIEASDLGIYTSETESFCLSILESMFLGKASLAFRVGGIPEVMEDGASGLLLEFGEVAGMAAAIDRLADDRETVERLGAAARRRAERLFTADAVVPQYLACYRAALAER